MATIELNSLRYVLGTDRDGKPLIRQSYVARLSQAFRTVGVQQRTDDTSVNRYLHRNFLKGFGADRIARETGEGLASFRDATCETRFPSMVTLPILSEDSTEATNDQVVRASASFKGDLWTLWENDDGAGNEYTAARSYTGSTTTWGGGNTFSPAASTIEVALDLIAHKTHLLALLANANDHYIYRSTDGSTWAAATTNLTLNLLSNSVTANENIDAGLLADVGGEAIAILWHEANGTITFSSSTDAGANWTDEAIDIPSGNGPQGVAAYPDIDGTTKLYVGTREGIWLVDTSPATWTTELVLPLPPSGENCRRMTVHQGRIWFGMGVDNNTPAPVGTLEVSGDTRVVDLKQGLDQASGLPAEMMGPIRWMKSAQQFLFASIGGGAASRNARVICHNGYGWHSVVRHGTANRQIQWIDVSADDDGTPRLHYAVRTATTTSDTLFVAQPLVDPASGVSIQYESSGYLRIPADDLGDPQTNATVYQSQVDADDLSATTSNEYIAHQYGVDGAVDTTTTLGNYLSGDKDLSYGSGAGIAAKTISHRLTFNRDATTNTDTPKLREFETQASNRLLNKKAWDFTIDIEATARETPPNKVANTPIQETIITNLETVAEATTMVTFTEGAASQVRVQVPNGSPPVWNLWVLDSQRQDTGYRTGYVTMHVEEGM